MSDSVATKPDPRNPRCCFLHDKDLQCPRRPEYWVGHSPNYLFSCQEHLCILKVDGDQVYELTVPAVSNNAA